MSLSSATGYWMSNFVTAARTFAMSFSNANSGECTPSTTSPAVLVVAIPGIHVRHRAQAVDARVRPEIDDHDLAAQALGRERLAVEPAGRARERWQRPSVFDGPLAPCADIIAPPSRGFFRGRHHHGAATRRFAARRSGNRLRARALRRAHGHGFATYSAGSMALKVAHLRKIVDDDVRIRRVIEQVVLVIGLGLVKAFQRIHARDDARGYAPALSSCAM